jgi:sugar-specific transcriptional regulator TrmB
MLRELQDMGLSEKEARVYLASLELGRTTAEKLAKHAKVNRSTTYVQLESLMKMGLMSTHEEGKKTYFSPESPELLKRLLLKQRDEIGARERDLTAIMPMLLQQFHGGGERPVVRFFPGKEGIQAVREEVLTSKDKHLYVVLSSLKMRKIFSEQEIEDYSARRKALGVHSTALYTDREYFNKAMNEINELTTHRLLPNSPLTIDIRIFGDKTALFSFEGSLFAMVIESKQIATSMKKIFDFLWEHSEKPNSRGKK